LAEAELKKDTLAGNIEPSFERAAVAMPVQILFITC
jgi:hypothetical protein